VVDLIANTRTEKGLRIEAVLDERTHDTGIKVPDASMAQPAIEPYPFHGEWNYHIKAKNNCRSQ
jgi:hypothetical protein